MCVAKFMSTPIYLIIMPPCVKSWVPPVADLGGARDVHPRGPNSFNFIQFLRKFGKILCWRPPGKLAPSPWGNPGSATKTPTYYM